MRGCARTNTKHICTWSQFLKPQASELQGSCQMFWDCRSPDVCLLHTPPPLLTKWWNSNHRSRRISSTFWMCSKHHVFLFPFYFFSSFLSLCLYFFFVLFFGLPRGNTWKLRVATTVSVLSGFQTRGCCYRRNAAMLARGVTVDGPS